MCDPPQHPSASPLSFNPRGRGCKGDGWNRVVTVYLLYLSLLSEGEREPCWRRCMRAEGTSFSFLFLPFHLTSPSPPPLPPVSTHSPISLLHLAGTPWDRGDGLITQSSSMQVTRTRSWDVLCLSARQHLSTQDET